MLRTIRTFTAIACMAALVGAADAQPAGPASESPLESEPALESEAAADALAPAPLTDEELKAARAEFESSLHHQVGRITLAGDSITLNVPDSFYFLDAIDGAKVLEEAWGNPPDSKVAGMLFPTDMSPLDEDAWGVVLTSDKSGYVSDADAAGLDYDMLIDGMREGLDQENAERTKQGYASINIVGWATQPRYDGKTHKLYWAKEIAFSGEPKNTLNYDMRVLGRYGVLSLNFVASIDQLAAVEQAAPSVLKIAEFDAGSRYEDFNASTDVKADYGVAGLIGGAAGAAFLAKNGGILAAVLLFLKKGFVLIIAAFGAIVAGIRGFFGRKSKVEVKAQQRSTTAFFDGPAVDAEAPPASSEESPPSV